MIIKDIISNIDYELEYWRRVLKQKDTNFSRGIIKGLEIAKEKVLIENCANTGKDATEGKDGK